MTSDSAHLTVNIPLSITHQPVSRAKCAGDSISFTITATGTIPISYQWIKNDTIISGATLTSYIIPHLSIADAGGYKCVLSNICGNDTSIVANLTVNTTSPTITHQPENEFTCLGNDISFTLTPSGSSPFSYQWLLNDTTQLWGYDSIYTVYYPISSDAGFYKCIVSNACGFATSDSATLTLNLPPSITQQPNGDTICSGSNKTFTVAASGTRPFSYQWYKNDTTSIANATDSLYTINAVSIADAGNYKCIVSNTCGSDTSFSAFLMLNTPLDITQQPADTILNTGAAITFSIEATGTEPFSYQWFKNDTIISGDTNSVFRIQNLTLSDKGGYKCIVSMHAVL